MVRVQSQDGGLAYKMGIRFFSEQRGALPTRERQAMSNMSGRNAMKWVDPHFLEYLHSLLPCCLWLFSCAHLFSPYSIFFFRPGVIT
jgi:hypothetical protein